MINEGWGDELSANVRFAQSLLVHHLSTFAFSLGVRMYLRSVVSHACIPSSAHYAFTGYLLLARPVIGSRWRAA